MIKPKAVIVSATYAGKDIYLVCFYHIADYPTKLEIPETNLKKLINNRTGLRLII
ncbi:hypothetical protein KJ365_15865 [Glaciecola sp. XM2]|uniref:hypothetical protein n=1 Tax=Glaciecola sp. XM2 TaxID=1914931 RepID=UPI001BDF25D2|nr:hypothetical protein [Glaciecola sp. XM2]MBT1452359.1 hypothetical protein [Glaciecola sp. XM2]